MYPVFLREEIEHADGSIRIAQLFLSESDTEYREYWLQFEVSRFLFPLSRPDLAVSPEALAVHAPSRMFVVGPFPSLATCNLTCPCHSEGSKHPTCLHSKQELEARQEGRRNIL